jgi:hypothetical protein
MKPAVAIFLSLLLLTPQIHAQDSDGPSPESTNDQNQSPGASCKPGSITLIGLYRYENYSPRIGLKSTTPALVNVTIKDKDGIAVGTAKIQLEKDVEAFTDVTEMRGGMQTGSTYTVSFSSQYMAETPTVTEIEMPAPPVSVWYSLAAKPEKVVQVSDISKPWSPQVVVNRPGYLNLIFNDDQNLIPQNVSKQYSATGPNANLTKSFEIDLNYFKDGYYRYHFEGGSDQENLGLSQSDESFLLIKDTRPVLEGLLRIDLKTEGNIAQLSFQLSQKISTELTFPGNVSIKVDGQGDKAPYSYSQNLSTDLVDLIRRLTGASTTASTKAPEPIELSLIARTGPHANEEIARISLQGLQNTSAATIAKLSAVKGTLKPADATNVAKEALGLQNQDTSKDPQASAVQYLTSLLTQKTSNLDKFISFLTVAGNVALSFYGVPTKIPAKTK